MYLPTPPDYFCKQLSEQLSSVRIGMYVAFQPTGFARPPVAWSSRALLPHDFTLARRSFSEGGIAHLQLLSANLDSPVFTML